MGLVLNGANRHDIKLTESMLSGLPPAAEAARQAHLASGAGPGLCLDAGYDYAQVREVATSFDYTAHIQPRGEEAQAKKRASKPAAGSWSASIPGSTGSAACSFAGPKNRKTT